MNSELRTTKLHELAVVMGIKVDDTRIAMYITRFAPLTDEQFNRALVMCRDKEKYFPKIATFLEYAEQKKDSGAEGMQYYKSPIEAPDVFHERYLQYVTNGWQWEGKEEAAEWVTDKVLCPTQPNGFVQPAVHDVITWFKVKGKPFNVVTADKAFDWMVERSGLNAPN
jgi:hypothetical protein